MSLTTDRIADPVAATPATRPDGDRLLLSFEFFPPKTDKMKQNLWQAVLRLKGLGPRFVSVTYGAGGSTRENTHETVIRIQREAGMSCAAHLTCVGDTCEHIHEIARRYWDAGIRHIVALRGDAPEETGTYTPHPGGYAYACDLVAGLRQVADFEISVGAYPETHPEAASADADMDALKRKIDAGAVRAITQFFFENDDFYRFVERAHAAGIAVPIVPGILPISHFQRMLSFAGKCGARVPGWLHERFGAAGDDAGAAFDLAVATAAEQCLDLRAHGAREFHFYTLNRADLTTAICRELGVEAEADQSAVAAS